MHSRLALRRGLVVTAIFANSLAASTLVADDLFQQTSGPGGGIIQHIAQTENGDVFVIAGGAVYRSTDVGSTWEWRSTLPASTVKLARGAGNRLYALNSALWVSENGAGSWTQLVNAPNPCRSLTVDPTGRLFAGSTSGLHRSTDLGMTWTNILAGDVGLVEAALDHSVWYSIGRTTVGHLDANGSALPGTTLPGEFTSVTVLRARIGGGVFAALGPEHLPVPSGGGIWRVNEDGSSSNLGVTSVYLSAIVARSQGTVFVTSTGFCYEGCWIGRVHKGTENGGFVGMGPATAVTGLVDASGTLIASTRETSGGGPPPEYTPIFDPAAGVMRSLDDGITWQPSSTGLPFSRILGLAVNPSSEVFAIADSWIYRSEDRGASWIAMGAPPGSNLIAPTPDDLYALSYSHVYSAPSHGSGTWTPHALPSSATMMVGTAQGTLLVLGTNSRHLMRSTDGATTWTQFVNAFPESWYTRFEAGPLGRVAISLGYPAANQIRISDDDGLNWTTIANLRGSLAFSEDEATLVVASDAGVFQLQESNGWMPVQLPTGGPVIWAELEVDHSGTVYATTSTKVWRWNPGDLYWAPMGPTAPPSFGSVGPLELAADGYLYVGTTSGAVWRSSAGTTDIAPEDDVTLATFGSFPNPFRGRTHITFGLQREEAVHLDLFDVGGRRIATLLRGATYPAGRHSILWEPEARLPRGIYLYEVRAGAVTRTGRVVLR